MRKEQKMGSRWFFAKWEDESDHLPEQFADIIFQDDKGEMYLGTMDALCRFIDKSGQSIENVIAWMEAPQPYEKRK